MPGNGNSYLRVEREDLQDTGMKITSAAKGIGEAVADAARRINALDGNWEGMSNQNFMPEFNASRTRAAAVSDGLTRLGSSLQQIGGTYETADNVPIEFDMNIAQDASGKASMSYSFVDANTGEASHVFNQFNHNGDGSVAVEMQEVDISAEGQPQMSHVHLSEENFNMGGYEPGAVNASGELPAELQDKFTGTPFGAMAGKYGQTPPISGAENHFSGTAGTPLGALGAATGQIGKDGEFASVVSLPDTPAPDRDGLLEQNVQNRLGMDPSAQAPQSLEERITEMNAGAGAVLDQVKNGELPTDAATPDAPRTSGGGGGSMPMQMSPLPPLQQQPSTQSTDLLNSAAPPAGYKEGDSLADKLMTAMVMDNMMDDSPLNRGGGGIGGFSGDTPQGVGTMDLTDSMQTLDFPGQGVELGAPALDTDPTAENPLEGIAQDFFEKPREMKINNVNPRDAEKD